MAALLGVLLALTLSGAADVAFDVDMGSFLSRHDLLWSFQWRAGDAHIPCVVAVSSAACPAVCLPTQPPVPPRFLPLTT